MIGRGAELRALLDLHAQAFSERSLYAAMVIADAAPSPHKADASSPREKEVPAREREEHEQSDWAAAQREFFVGLPGDLPCNPERYEQLDVQHVHMLLHGPGARKLEPKPGADGCSADPCRVPLFAGPFGPRAIRTAADL